MKIELNKQLILEEAKKTTGDYNYRTSKVLGHAIGSRIKFKK